MRRIALALTALAAVVATGCGGSGGQTVSTNELTPEAILARAADATVAANSARMRFDMEMRGLPDTDVVKMHGGGAIDFTQHVASMTMEIPSVGEMQMLMDDTVIYMRVPQSADSANMLDGKSWIRLDMKEAAKLAGVDTSQQMWSDPRETLAMLEGVSGGIDVVGEDDIDGVHTTHYHAVVDIRRALEKRGSIVDEKQFEQFLSKMGDEIPMDVWIDDANQVRRTQIEMSLGQVDAKVTMDLYDFGTDVSVSPPPAADVVDLADLVAENPGAFHF